MTTTKNLPSDGETGNGHAAALEAAIAEHKNHVARERAIDFGMAVGGLERIEAWCAMVRAEIDAHGPAVPALLELAANINAMLSRVPVGGTADRWLAVMHYVFAAADSFVGTAEIASESAYQIGLRHADRFAPDIAEKLRGHDVLERARAAIRLYLEGNRAAAATALSNAIGLKDINNAEWKRLQAFRSRRAHK